MNAKEAARGKKLGLEVQGVGSTLDVPSSLVKLALLVVERILVSTISRVSHSIL